MILIERLTNRGLWLAETKQPLDLMMAKQSNNIDLDLMEIPRSTQAAHFGESNRPHIELLGSSAWRYNDTCLIDSVHTEYTDAEHLELFPWLTDFIPERNHDLPLPMGRCKTRNWKKKPFLA